jgi:DNA repair exonuclease SbcCD ATPase subunit
MQTDETRGEDLAGNDQAVSKGQTNDAEVWQQKYAGLQGKVLGIQTQLTETQLALANERSVWTNEKGGLTGRVSELEKALEAAQNQLTDLGNKWNEASTKAQQLEQQAARQQVMLKHPQLVSDPLLKLVTNSTMSAEELEEALGALSQGQQQLVTQTIQKTQTGSTPALGSAALSGNSSKQEQRDSSWQAAITAMQKGEMDTYRSEYAKYLALAEESGASQLSAPAMLTGIRI